jgi:AcrR family transcriptional regulator
MARPLDAGDTREKLLDSARTRFAARGFYGASLAEIARDVGATKQTLLHHFGSKERLYAAVLKQIAATYEARIEALEAEIEDPLELLETLMLGRLESQMGDKREAQIVMRELMDNQDRADRVSEWYLKPWLDRLAEVVRKIPGEKLTRPEALAVVYQLVGAVGYLGVSEPTLSGMFGQRNYRQLTRSYPDQLRSLIRHRFQR